MTTFITLLSFTGEGITNIDQSVGRASSFREQAPGMGIEVVETYWTVGAYDGVLIIKAPDVETATAAMLKLGKAHNVKTETLTAFDGGEFQKVLAKLG